MDIPVIPQASKCDASQYPIYNREDALSLFGDKDIYIWGAGQKGRGFLLALKRNGIAATAFLDSKETMVGETFLDTPIIHPETLFNDKLTSKKAFILTASVDSKHKEMFAICEANGFKRGVSYDNIQTLSPLYPTVEITGVCNIRCPSCPRGNPDSPLVNGSYMSLENYKKVLDKLIEEIPFLYLVDLYIWSEPILNKSLPEMINYSKSRGIACGLSTNLNNIRGLSDVIKAEPAQLRVSLSGAEPETYDITHDGGKWEKVEANMYELARLIELHQTNTLVEVYFHVYKHNVQDYPKLKKLCSELGFNLVPSIAMLFPDYAMDYVKGKEWNPKTQKVHDLMFLDIDELLEDAQKQDEKMCLLTRVFPVINYDMSVMACCNYSYNQLNKSYLDIPLQDLIKQRTVSNLCTECQSHSMHRYFNPVFYTDYIKKTLEPYQ